MSSTRMSRCFSSSALRCAYLATALTLTRFPGLLDYRQHILTGRESAVLLVPSHGSMICKVIGKQLTERSHSTSISQHFEMQFVHTLHICPASSRSFTLIFSAAIAATVARLVSRLTIGASAYFPSLRCHSEFQLLFLDCMT